MTTELIRTESMPGTKWRGPWNTASSYDDLGRHKQVDMCYPDHDFCDNISSEWENRVPPIGADVVKYFFIGNQSCTLRKRNHRLTVRNSATLQTSSYDVVI
ncbi:Phospholipase A2 isozymes PA3A/PA3B/PA5 [Pseudolycoriella hygida]|uniref:Phospholipase A2 isozymes PA3A/PA3B/PA5 n=1 Tax=Pseudolycoriella hygida TaxID=35572 RepID=A0A9Q0N026_9DIPT|nr:Phospholipase A2 isozymes PA3A/PA3B/PA5 [Pseudolycoriella hygida]